MKHSAASADMLKEFSERIECLDAKAFDVAAALPENVRGQMPAIVRDFCRATRMSLQQSRPLSETADFASGMKERAQDEISTGSADRLAKCVLLDMVRVADLAIDLAAATSRAGASQYSPAVSLN